MGIFNFKKNKNEKIEIDTTIGFFINDNDEVFVRLSDVREYINTYREMLISANDKRNQSAIFVLGELINSFKQKGK